MVYCRIHIDVGLLRLRDVGHIMQELTKRLIEQALSKEKGRGVIEAEAKDAGYLAALSLT